MQITRDLLMGLDAALWAGFDVEIEEQRTGNGNTDTFIKLIYCSDTGTKTFLVRHTEDCGMVATWTGASVILGALCRNKLLSIQPILVEIKDIIKKRKRAQIG